MNLTRFSRGACFTAALTAFAALVAPREAEACGGFFCSRTPVDQTAEHILFTVNDDQTVTAIVQIKYVGDKDDFAWIIPAPGNPKLSADFPDLALSALDTNTEPQYYSSCAFRGGPTFGAAPSASNGAAQDASKGVTVVAMQNVGPYETVTLKATGADVLVKWLKDNNYRLTDKMIPLLQPYVEGGMNFVAMRLMADKAVSDIKPLGMTYDGNKPMIPIRLTAIAAQPEMGIVTWILADRRWGPENYIDLKIPDSLIKFDSTYYGKTNYLTLVSSETDKVGGQAFVTEYAKSTADLATLVQQTGIQNPMAQSARDALLPLLQKFPYITRLYARMSAEEMTDDPTFMVASSTTDVNNVHDLSSQDAGCSFPPNPPPVDPCTFNYCGRRGVCVGAPMAANATTGAAATVLPACVCANDATARVTTTTDGQPSMYCEPVAQNLDAASSGSSGPLLQPACEGFDCGAHGACVAMNGNPTCQCEGGYAAVVTTSYDASTSQQVTKTTCLPAPANVPPLPVLPKIGSTQLSPGDGTSPSQGNSGGCAVTPAGRATSAAALLASLGAVVAAARRRRRAS